MIETVSEPPSGWFVLDVMRQQKRKGNWAALMVDVDPNDLEFCACDFPARFYVHPNDYQPAEGRPARQCFVSIPGKHRSRKDAWKALHDLMDAKLH